MNELEEFLGELRMLGVTELWIKPEDSDELHKTCGKKPFWYAETTQYGEHKSGYSGINLKIGYEYEVPNRIRETDLFKSWLKNKPKQTNLLEI